MLGKVGLAAASLVIGFLTLGMAPILEDATFKMQSGTAPPSAVKQFSGVKQMPTYNYPDCPCCDSSSSSSSSSSSINIIPTACCPETGVLPVITCVLTPTPTPQTCSPCESSTMVLTYTDHIVFTDTAIVPGHISTDYDVAGWISDWTRICDFEYRFFIWCLDTAGTPTWYGNMFVRCPGTGGLPELLSEGTGNTPVISTSCSPLALVGQFNYNTNTHCCIDVITLSWTVF